MNPCQGSCLNPYPERPGNSISLFFPLLHALQEGNNLFCPPLSDVSHADSGQLDIIVQEEIKQLHKTVDAIFTSFKQLVWNNRVVWRWVSNSCIGKFLPIFDGFGETEKYETG